MSQAQLPWLPVDEEKLAVRQDIRDDKSIKDGKRTYFVKLEEVKTFDGYNGRIVYPDIEDLANSIEENGLRTPLSILMLKDGTKKLVRGNRRIKALETLSERYASRNEAELFYKRFEWVESFFLDSSTTDQDLLLDQFISNDYRQFNPVENGRNVGLLEDFYGMSHDEISRKTGVSRQTIDNWSKVNKLPQEQKDAINRGELSMNKVLNELRDEKKAEKPPKYSAHVEAPLDNRDEETSSEGKGVGQTIALQNDRKLDAETEAAKAEEKLFQANSEEQDMLNRVLSNLDSIQVMVKKVADIHPKLYEDIARLCEFGVNDLTKVREVLAKLQKN